MTFKQKIKQHHLVLLQDKIDVYQDMISGLSEGAQNDAKGRQAISTKRLYR